jgi:uncharacterized protein YggE
MRLAILTALSALELALAGPVAAQPVVTLAPGETLLNVEAEGEVQSRPDVMAISAGVVTTGATAAEAVPANATLAQRLIAAVHDAGIGARDVRTTNFHVEPRFEGGRREEDRDDTAPPRIIGYVVENTVSIELHDLSTARSVISHLFEAGANSVSGPTFGLSNDESARRAAERAAIAEARAKADNYAVSLGRRVGRVLRIGERQVWTESDNEGQTIMVTGNRIPATPIEPGEISTRARIYVDFALAPQ